MEPRKNQRSLFRNLLFGIIYLFTFQPGSAQSPGWEWAHNAGPGVDAGISVVSSADGHSYVIGYFSSTITFGSTILISAGNYDVFLVKYDPVGSVVWATSFGGADADFGYGIALDQNGNTYVTGKFCSTSMPINSLTLTNMMSNGTSDIFIAEFNSRGNDERLLSL